MAALFQIVVVSLCVAALAARECGVRSARFEKPGWKIVGGEDAEPLEWPWQISLRLLNLDTGAVRGHICGGSVIDKEWVMTAAHCVDGSANPKSYQVRVGEHNLKVDDGTEVDLAVTKVIKHPSWNSRTINNDVALLKLATPLDLDGAHSHIGVSCLADSSVSLDGRMCTTTGWGLTKHQGSQPDVLQKVDVPIWKNDVCRRAFLFVNTVTNGMVCAGYDEGGKSVCNGDSGGPLQCRLDDGKWYQAGITSWGVGCAWPRYPGVFARVPTYRQWVLDTIGSN